MTTAFELERLVGFARQHSDYYARLFSQIGPGVTTLSELPVVDPQEYWVSSHDLDRWPVLTATLAGARVFKTGGTTGSGKLSVFTREEWQTLVTDFGQQLTAQLCHGDRVANLFFVGDLYASFLFIHDALAHVGVGVSEFPFTGNVGHAALADSILKYRINVLAGVPAHLLAFAAWLEGQSRTAAGVDTLLYGGESLFAGQMSALRRVFPNARIASIGYASVDAGFIGASSRDCEPDEHRMLEQHSVLEILDEQTGEVIEACGRTGRLVLTNLTRQLMPVIRYPVGDLACWREPRGTARRKFALMGRSASSQRVRVGSLTLMMGDVSEIVQRIAEADDWQLVIAQVANRDVLSLKWQPAASADDPQQTSAVLHQTLLAHYPLIAQLGQDDLLELQVICCAPGSFANHPRSGKRQRVLDLRVYSCHQPEQCP